MAVLFSNQDKIANVEQFRAIYLPVSKKSNYFAHFQSHFVEHRETNRTRIGSFALRTISDNMTTSWIFVIGFSSKFLIISPMTVRNSIIANFCPRKIQIISI